MSNDPLQPLTIAAAAELLRGGKLKPLDLVEQCLRRIDALDDRVRAWVLVDREGARRQAAEAAAEMARGNYLGPLHGIPLGIKDIMDVAGFPTRAGSTITSDRPVKQDSTVVARLRAAGAVILGKTVTTEFASFDPPPTRNPWNLERTPGGSSSGSAAALACGMCLGAMGSQTGGSITRPASYCGVAGLKPTYGAVSLDGIVPLAFHLDHPGPMARCATDLAMMFAALTCDPEAPQEWAFAPASLPPMLGVAVGYFEEFCDSHVREVTSATLDKLRRAGANVVPIDLPVDFHEAFCMHRRMMAVGAADFHRTWFPERRSEYGLWIASLLDEGLALQAIDYAQAFKFQEEFRETLWALMHELSQVSEETPRVAALVMPATTTTAPLVDSTGDPRFNSVWSLSHLPVASIPCGVAADGLPVALQFVGPPFAERSLLADVAWCERALDFDARATIAEGLSPL
jgi:aspartyl-tRNA(Asn)/glutamyl-tRNA(Gln) amidotransferase subunit A